MKEIIVDTLGADADGSVLVRGAIQAHHKNPSYNMVLFGNKEEMEKTFQEVGESFDGYTLIDADTLSPEVHDVMAMLRYKGHSSLTDAMDYLSSHEEAAGLLTAGSTGMVLVSAIKRIGLLDGVSFPALAAMLPNIHGGRVCLVDCGANLEVPAEKLVQFAKLGAALSSAYCGIENPRVGLMNVGKEDTKGDSLRKKTFALLKETDLNFVGNLEGSDLLLDKADVITCDGFTGNCLLKNAEAVGLIASKMVLSLGKDDPSIKKASHLLSSTFSFTELGASIVLGCKKMVLKAHGAANEKTIATVSEDIIRLDENHLLEKLPKYFKANDVE